ncbi:MAG: response regulator [Spirochaetota bacterium]
MPASHQILLVEDTNTTAALISKILQENDFKVIDTVNNGEDAIVAAREKMPDLIIMDIYLKGKMDGIEAAKKINSEMDMPIIFLTGSDNLNNFDRIAEASPYGYLTKPFKSSDLIYSIKTSLYKHELTLKLEENKEYLNALLSSLVTILIGISGNDSIIYWNNIAEDTFGVPASKMIGLQLMESGIKWDWIRVYEGISRSITEEKPVRLDDLRFTNPGSSEGFLDISINAVKNKKNKLTGFILTGEDITKRKQLELQLVQTQKLESVGRLSAGIAHEINTPTQYITDNTYFLKDAFSSLVPILHNIRELIQSGENASASFLKNIEKMVLNSDLNYLTEEIPKAIDQSIEGLGRVAKIVQSMKSFSHPGTDSKVPISINNTIDNIITISRNEWKYAADITTHFNESLPSVLCYPGKFNQVLLNIIINAADAIKEKLGPNPVKKGLIDIITFMENDNVVIRIKDTGTGIPDKIKGKIFDPFFTTKDVGKGTGQGLSIAYDIIVNDHKGEISCESEPGTGTTFIIKIPVK